MIHWSNLGKQTTVLFLLLAVGLAMVLFSVKYQVQDLEDELAALNRAIAFERQSTHVLRAEFSYLTDPERLRRLSEQYLDLEPVQSHQIGSFASLGDSPDRTDAQAASGAPPLSAAAEGFGR